MSIITEGLKPAASVEVLVIPEKAGLDQITVYWHNYEPGKGMVTLVCWGCAWNCYFGGMLGETIQEFFLRVGTDYLVPKLGVTRWLKKSRHHDAYLKKLIDAVKSHLRDQGTK